LSSIVEAPLAAGTEASLGTTAAEIGEAAISAAMRRALVRAVGRLIFSEAFGYALNWATNYINESEDIPSSLQKAWNGLMIALMIYGGVKLVRQGIKAFRNVGSANFRLQIQALEKELETGLRAERAELSNAEAAAEAEIEAGAAQKFKQATSPGEPKGT